MTRRIILSHYPTILVAILVLIMFWLSKPSFAEDSSYIFSGKDASAVIANALAANGAGENLKVHINGARDQDIVAGAASPIDAQVDGFILDSAHNRWQTTLILSAAGKNLAPVNLSGSFDTIVQVPTLKKELNSNNVISENDIVWQDEVASHIHKTTIMDPKDLIGKSPKHTISEGRPIRQEEITGASIVTKGERITLVYKSNALVIKTLGEAMDTGAKGDVIRVKNVESKSVIQGTVEAAGIVRVTSPDATSADAL